MARTSDTAVEKLDPSLVHKKKARRRLVGAVSFLAAVGASLPFILDSEPKPNPQDVIIHVPAREPLAANSPAPAVPPAASTPPMAGATATPPMVPPVLIEPSVTKDEAKKDEAKKEDAKKEDAAKPAPKDTKKDEAKKSESKKDSPKKDPPTNDDAKPAKDDKSAKSDKKPEERKGYTVQIGAFANEESAKEQQVKAAKLGLKAYTEKVITGNGTRVRVRVGPFSSREQADQALAKLKLNGVEAAVVAP